MFYGCAIIPTAIWGASLVLWVGVHSSLRGLRTLGSIRPWSRTVGSIAATGDGNYGAGRLTCPLWSDPIDSPAAPQYQGWEALFSPSDHAPAREDLALKR